MGQVGSQGDFPVRWERAERTEVEEMDILQLRVTPWLPVATERTSTEESDG